MRRHHSTLGAPPAPLDTDWDRKQAIVSLLERGRLRPEETPGTFARLAVDERSAARNARGYVAYYETQAVEAELPHRRDALTKAVAEQRALVAFHAARYLVWRRKERAANRRVDELLRAANEAADNLDSPRSSATPSAASLRGVRAGGGR